MEPQCQFVCVPFEEGKATRLFKVADRYAGLWLIAAMVVGWAVGHLVPGAQEAIERVTLGQRNLLVLAGLILMMYPPLARVQYEKLHVLMRNRRLLGLSVLQNWIVGPLLMFGIAVFFFADRPEFMIGLIVIGLVRCIDSVIVWNDLAEGDCHYCAGLAGTNILFQVVLLPVYAYLFLTVLPDVVGLGGVVMDAPMNSLVRSELVYLVIPLVAGIIPRYVGLKKMGELRYEAQFVPVIRPISLLAKIFTVGILFLLQGTYVVDLALEALLIAVPLAIYFFAMFGISFFLSAKFGASYEQSTTLSFTAASSNFALASAVSTAVFGIGSGEALVAVIGPMVEVPVVVALVYVSLWLRRKLYRHRIECIGGSTSRNYRVGD
jgi:ACR3 family arsenite transporter